MRRPGVMAVDLIDLRCSAVLITADVKGRCQLRVGHHGAHATVLGHDDEAQYLYSWRVADEFTAAPYEQTVAAGLAWAPGMPTAQPRRRRLTSRRWPHSNRATPTAG